MIPINRADKIKLVIIGCVFSSKYSNLYLNQFILEYIKLIEHKLAYTQKGDIMGSKIVVWIYLF